MNGIYHYYFTFAKGQVHNDIDMSPYYVSVFARCEAEARIVMMSYYGTEWAHCFDSVIHLPNDIINSEYAVYDVNQIRNTTKIFLKNTIAYYDNNYNVVPNHIQGMQYQVINGMQYSQPMYNHYTIIYKSVIEFEEERVNNEMQEKLNQEMIAKEISEAKIYIAERLKITIDELMKML